MRQAGYYAAQWARGREVEVIEIRNDNCVFRTGINEAYTVGQFIWISDTPIELPHRPIELKQNHYYAIRVNDETYIALYNGNTFWVGATGLIVTGCEIISDGFKPEDLAKLMPR